MDRTADTTAASTSVGSKIISPARSRSLFRPCGDTALFAAIDVDERFPERLPILRNAIKTFGGAALADACFRTEGSDAGRGKIIITFDEPVPRQHAYDLVRKIATIAKQSTECGSKKIDLYPEGKTGGVVRILGRNPKRNGPIEKACTLYKGADLTDVVPVSAAHIASLVADDLAAQERASTSTTTVSAATTNDVTTVATPVQRINGPHQYGKYFLALTTTAQQRKHTNEIRKDFCHVGTQVQRHGGDLNDYIGFLRQMKANSPALDEPSKKNGDTRNPVDRELDEGCSAWYYSLHRAERFKPMEPPAKYKRGERRVWHLYLAVFEYALDQGFDPRHVKLPNTILAKLLGTRHPRDAGKVLDRVVDMDLIVSIDRGRAHQKDGPAGRTKMFALVYEGASPESILADIAEDPKVMEAREEAKFDQWCRDNRVMLQKKCLDPGAHGWDSIGNDLVAIEAPIAEKPYIVPEQRVADESRNAYKASVGQRKALYPVRKGKRSYSATELRRYRPVIY